jgi:AMP nucleosidase
MECTTLFSASYKNRFNLGALLLISDLPLEPKWIKTKDLSDKVFEAYTADHVEKRVRILKSAREMLAKRVKGGYNKEDVIY